MLRKRKQNLIPLLAMTAIASFSACTREAINKPLTDAAITIGPSSKDVVLNLAPPSANEIKKSLQMNGAVSSADYFRTAELLQEIAKEDNNENLSRYAKGMVSSFYENRNNFTQSSFSQSLYITAMVGEAEPLIHEQLAKILIQLGDGKTKITKLLEKSSGSYPWPQQSHTLPELVSTADKYVNWLLTQMPKQGIAPELAKPAIAAIREEYSKLRPRIIRHTQKFHGSQNIKEGVKNLKELMGEFAIESGPEQEKDLAKALDLDKAIEDTKTSGQALNLLIKLWRAVPPEDREATFKPASPEIYEFLNGKSDAALDCLLAPVCINPLLLAAQVVVMGKLEEYGVEKLKLQMSQAILTSIKDSVIETALKELPKIPFMIRDEMDKEIGKFLALIDTVRNDTITFARKNAENWSKTELAQLIPGVEAANVNVSLQNGRYKVAAEKNSTATAPGAIQTGAETLGVSLSITHKFLPTEKQKQRSALVGSLVKLLAMGGFRSPGGASYSSYAMAMDGPRNKFHNLKTVLGDESSFAVPDAFQVKPDLAMDRVRASANSSVAAQAELLRGVSAQIKYLRDWEKNEFDEVLSSVQVEDLAPDVPKGAVNESAFPKRLLFALAVGNAAIQLQNITKNLSPAFLILPEGEFLWGNQYREISEGKVSAVAGMVNIENGKRGTVVRTVDIARYILAMDAFLDATEGVENTNSEPLLEKSGDDSSVIDQLTEARKYLRLFMMGLTNYLVYVAQDKDGGFHGYHILKPGVGTERVPDGRILQDQALAIRALSVSAKRLKMGIYSWAALDGYYFLNRSFWDSKNQFYVSKVGQGGNKIGTPNLLEVANTIRALRELQGFMPLGSRVQWQKIERPWTQALDSL
jgi:hypothetical protein